MVYKNLAYGTVLTAPSPATSGTSLVLGSGQGAYFPQPSTDGAFYITIFPISSDPTFTTAEICQVTARTTDTLTIVRAQKSTSARTVIVGDRVIQGIYAEDIMGSNSFVGGETPSGTVDGSNATFTLVSTPVSGTLALYRDGQLMKGGGADYTLTTNSIAFVTAPVTGSVLLAFYYFSNAGTSNADTVDGYHANATPTANNIPVLDAQGALFPDGWTPLGYTMVYASASTFTVAGVDLTLVFTKGTRIKWNEGATVKYGVVVASSFSTNTTVTIAVNTDYVITNTTLSSPFYSYQANPRGYPTWFNYTLAYTGFSSNPTSVVSRFAVVGKKCFLTWIEGVNGTSNSTSKTISLPIPASASMAGVCIFTNVIDNGVQSFGKLIISPSDTTSLIYPSAGGVWTASGGCRIANNGCIAIYEI